MYLALQAELLSSPRKKQLGHRFLLTGQERTTSTNYLTGPSQERQLLTTKPKRPLQTTESRSGPGDGHQIMRIFSQSKKGNSLPKPKRRHCIPRSNSDCLLNQSSKHGLFSWKSRDNLLQVKSGTSKVLLLMLIDEHCPSMPSSGRV